MFSTTAGRLAVALVPSHQVSLATGIGGLGLRFGSALGFITPALIVPSGLDVITIGQRLRIYDGTILTVSVICFVVFFFLYQTDKERGSAAQSRRIEWAKRLTAKERETINHGIKAELFWLDIRLLVRCLCNLLKNKALLMLLIGHRNTRCKSV